MKHEQTASAEALPNAARIQRVDGNVALSNGVENANETTDGQWIAASANQPFSVGDRIYTRENSHASLALTGRNFVRLNPNSSLDVLSFADRRTQLALRDGSAMFDVGYLATNELFEVATPYGAVDFEQPGLYNVGIDNGNVIISALSGLAQVVGLGGSGQVRKGEVLRLLGQTADDVVLSRMDGRDAGYLVDDYYGYQYPQYYDGRYRDYNTYLSDPYYFDPYRRNVSYQYASGYIPGLNDLDYYGSWKSVGSYGYAWSPRVDQGWSPYRDGYWMTDYPYGPTWISSEPWGYAPYHYGRWAYVGDRWYWVPGGTNITPIYSPALVAFLPFNQNEIGWVPLGPGDPYVARYYNSDWQPYYYDRTDYRHRRYLNVDVPGAVTFVPINDFTRTADWSRARRADRQMLANINPVLDPLTLTPLRNAVIHSAWGRGKIDLPPGIARKLRDTTVVTSVTPVAPASRKDLARTMRVERVSDGALNKKFKVKDERQGTIATHGAQPQDETRGPDRSQGKNEVRREAARVEQTQRPQRQNQQRVERAMPPAQGERVARPARQEVQGERGGSPQQPVRREAVTPQPVRTSRGPERVREAQQSRPAQQRPVRQMRQQSAPRAVERRGPPAQIQPRPQAQPRPQPVQPSA